ncbi:hypothetical protein BBJK_02474 [Bifidobacterium bifidum LMG 13195]|uniref:Uncharacterized protein n=1 Tax=Bifidobacterium bifidum LMG 13195 TaxID=1207542 RepID=A0A286TEM0_BIFBI|nr:hypothetical protein BBJK_02474 [Bifidobacterium bifidum LMG 13195]
MENGRFCYSDRFFVSVAWHEMSRTLVFCISWQCFDQAVTASGATMQAGPDSLAETKMAGEARKDSSFRECSSSDGCWYGDRCLAHGDYGAD